VAMTLLKDFMKDFPGRCPICAAHRFGFSEGLTNEARPKPHDCPDRKPTSQDVTSGYAEDL
jgi:hypothetical protein